jgi:hypothetical protein
MALVLLKLIVCAYLSYAFGLLFVHKEPRKKLHDFTFFYGSVPTSSAPLMFAAAFDPTVVEIVASAVLFGYILAGPNMFVMALFLSREEDDMTATLKAVQGTAGILSAVCGGLCLCWMLLTKKLFTPSGSLLGFYSIAVFLYGSVDFMLGRNCGQKELWLVFNFLQGMCTVVVLYLQLLLSSRFTICWHRRPISWILAVSITALLSCVTSPLALDQICEITPILWVRISTVVERLILWIIIFGLLIWRACQSSHGDDGSAQEALLEEKTREHPIGIMQALCMAQGIRVLAQVVNSIDSVFHDQPGGVMGGRVQILIIEQVLEVGQGIILFIATLLQQWDLEAFRAIRSWFVCSCCGLSRTRETGDEGEVSNTFLDPGDSIAFLPDQAFLRGVSNRSCEGALSPASTRRRQTWHVPGNTPTNANVPPAAVSFSHVELPDDNSTR